MPPVSVACPVTVPTASAAVSVLPVVSSSFVSVTFTGSRLPYTASVLAGVSRTVYCTFPSSMSSSCPVTVTVCAVFQSAAPNVRFPGAAMPSLSS